MSTKQAAFVKILGNPQNTHNFLVSTKLLTGRNLLVQITSFPTEALQLITMHYLGEEILYPAMPKTSGQWICKIPESETAYVFAKLMLEKGAIYAQKSGIQNPVVKTEITVFARTLNDVDVFYCVMHGAWISTREAVPLDNSLPTTNWVWTVTFNYDWIEDGSKLVTVEPANTVTAPQNP